jgi:hypothetical protein
MICVSREYELSFFEFMPAHQIQRISVPLQFNSNSSSCWRTGTCTRYTSRFPPSPTLARYIRIYLQFAFPSNSSNSKATGGPVPPRDTIRVSEFWFRHQLLPKRYKSQFQFLLLADRHVVYLLFEFFLLADQLLQGIQFGFHPIRSPNPLLIYHAGAPTPAR